MQQRRDEIEAKRAKLAEIKRQREERQREFAASRQSLGSPLGSASSPRRNENRQELDSLISSLIGETKTTSPAQQSPASPTRTSRFPSRVAFDSGHGTEQLHESANTPAIPKAQQALSFAPLKTVYEIKADLPKPEVINYSKGVQTTDQWTSSRSSSFSDSDVEERLRGERPPMRKLSRRQKEKEEEFRTKIRSEVEEELRALQLDSKLAKEAEETPAKHDELPHAMTTEELEVVTKSHDFMDFLDRSSKVAERALAEDYDVLADYRFDYMNSKDKDDLGGPNGRTGRRIKETLQFYDERWSKKRMISDLEFSPKFPELVLASYTKNSSAPNDPNGLIQIWNMHMQNRPEYSLHATSDILTAKFHPFYPNLVLGGCYTGQVMLWDIRSRSHSPVQQTSLTGAGHSHPVYSLNVVGTQNAHNIITTSTDGIVCTWATDMLSVPQQRLLLRRPPPVHAPGQVLKSRGPFANDLAVTCTAFPPSQTTYFLAGTELGPIHLCHRQDRADTPAGADQTLQYSAHSAPVMSMDFHNAAGPHNLADLVLSTGLDWGIKLWRVKAPGSAVVFNYKSDITHIKPLLEIARDDAVYDAKWSPVKPGVFASVDGGGWLEIWDLNTDLEEPAARERTAPRGKLGMDTSNDASATMAGSRGAVGAGGFAAGMEGVGGGRSLNKCAWDPVEGKRIAVGGLDGVVSVFEVGGELGGMDSARSEEWDGVKMLVSRLEGGWL